MKTRTDAGELISPSRLLEMLEFRFGVFRALAYAACEIANKGPETDPPMDKLTAYAILEFGDDLNQAYEAAIEWIEEHPIEIQADPDGSLTHDDLDEPGA